MRLLLVACAIPAVFGSAAASAADTTGRLVGKVSSSMGAPPASVVYLENVSSAEPELPAKAQITAKDTEFQPAAVHVPVGSVVEFPNLDKIYHNTFSPTPGDEFDLGLYRGGVAKSVTLKSSGEVDVYCNIHPNMRAKVLVLPNRFHAEAGPGGGYAIEGIPPGRYIAIAWSAEMEPARQEVVIKAGASTAAQFTLTARRSQQAHLNKSGQLYGRYK